MYYCGKTPLGAVIISLINVSQKKKEKKPRKINTRHSKIDLFSANSLQASFTAHFFIKSAVPYRTTDLFKPFCCILMHWHLYTLSGCGLEPAANTGSLLLLRGLMFSPSRKQSIVTRAAEVGAGQWKRSNGRLGFWQMAFCGLIASRRKSSISLVLWIEIESRLLIITKPQKTTHLRIGIFSFPFQCLEITGPHCNVGRFA